MRDGFGVKPPKEIGRACKKGQLEFILVIMYTVIALLVETIP